MQYCRRTLLGILAKLRLKPMKAGASGATHGRWPDAVGYDRIHA